jgi:DNA-binding transcriptional LysR family regulator
MIDLRLLHSFVVVAETEHVGRAAERLHISQSPLSRQIRQLEDQLGLRLFERERQRIRLTDAGRWLLTEGRELLSRAQRLESDAGALVRGERGRLAIGFVNAALWSRVLPATLRRFQRARPEVRLELRALRSDLQVRALQNGELDVGLVHRAPRTDLVCVPLFDEPFALALPAGHRLAGLEVVRPKDLGDASWVGLSKAQHPAAHAHFLRLGRRAGFVPEVRHQTGDRATALALVASGLGIALLPASARRLGMAGVVFRDLPWLTATTGIDLVHPAALSAAARRFVELAIGVAAGKGADAGRGRMRASPA